MGILDTIGFDEGSIVDVSVNSNEQIVYDFQLAPNVIDGIIVIETPNSMHLDISEGNLHDDVMIDDIGNLYIDGNKVDNSGKACPTNALETNPAHWVTIWSSDPISGAGAYSYIGSYSNPSVNLGKTIAEITLGALGVVFSVIALFTGNVELVPIFGYMATASGAAALWASAYRTVATKVNPTTKIGSCVISIYQCKSSSSSIYFKFTGTYWAGYNYAQPSGTPVVLTNYAHNILQAT